MLYIRFFCPYTAPAMTSAALHTAAKGFVKPRPEVRPGYTVRVHERIQEGNKERIQVFEGLVIAVHKGATATDSTFTVRRIASGVGVERVFSLHSPKIEKIEVKKVAKVRRAKLFFLRGRRGKAARLSERFTTADEFAVAAPLEVVANEPEEAVVAEEAASADDVTPTESQESAEASDPAPESAEEAPKEAEDATASEETAEKEDDNKEEGSAEEKEEK